MARWPTKQDNDLTASELTRNPVGFNREIISYSGVWNIMIYPEDFCINKDRHWLSVAGQVEVPSGYVKIAIESDPFIL